MGRGIRKQGAASIFAGGFFRFAVYACVVCAVIYVGKSAYDFGYAIFDQIPVDDEDQDRKSTRLNSSHIDEARMPSSA